MWFKSDDQWVRNGKVRRAGLHGRALWHVAGVLSAADATEGVIDDVMLDDAVHFAECDRDEAVTRLVASGLWHDAETIRKCPRCRKAVGKLAPGSYYFHDWLDYQFTRDETKIPELRMRKMRSKRLSRDLTLREQIVERDQGCCRYCGIRVDFRNRVGGDGGTYDHVDPGGTNTLDNVVVACRTCNGRKRDRTPAEAGMELRPVPDLAPARTGSDPGQTPDQPPVAPGSPTRTRVTRDGPGRAPDWPVSGPGQVPASSGHSNGVQR